MLPAHSTHTGWCPAETDHKPPSYTYKDTQTNRGKHTQPHTNIQNDDRKPQTEEEKRSTERGGRTAERGGGHTKRSRRRGSKRLERSKDGEYKM